jgi:HEPN domain-containing protein
MMTKEDHIAWWKSSSEDNWETAIYLKNGRQNLFALFAFHLVIEKLLKAHWVKDNVSNHPPRTHDLNEIYQQTELNLLFEQVDYLNAINNWNIEGRYPDYKNKIQKQASDQYLEHHLEKLTDLRKCLLEKL